MRTAFELSNPAALDHDVLGSTTTCTDTPLLVIPRRAFADYDAANDRNPVAAALRPDSYEIQWAARAHRAHVIGELVASAIHSVVATARRVRAHVRERRQARVNQDDFRRLDEHALRDLGLTGSTCRPACGTRFLARTTGPEGQFSHGDRTTR